MLGRIVPDGAGRPPDALTEAALQALGRFPPIGAEQIELDAELPAGFLARLRLGDVRATPAVLERLATALDTWSTRCREGAAVLRLALEED